MVKTPSRWTQWVISESANPRIPMPWALRRQRRKVAKPVFA
ncbi:hypothetical protein [Pararhodobacter zhoushanensis]|nr:hypothetical protein [Pararhodobacter zhoushanensis]